MAGGNMTFDSKTGHAKGRYKSLHQGFDLALEPIQEGAGGVGSDRPSHDVYIGQGDGLVRAGRAWTKQIMQGEKAGQRFFSMTIDDPSFPEPLNLAAFQADKDGKMFDLTWNRPRQARDAA